MGLMQRRLLISAAIGYGLCGACKPANEANLEIKTVRGLPVQVDDLVASYTVAIMDPDPTIGQYCSGIVIADDLVLTAAHCFSDPAHRPYVMFSRFYNPKLSNKEQPLIKARRLALHAQFSPEKFETYTKQLLEAIKMDQLPSPGKPLYDIALLYFEDKVPDRYEPVAIARGPAQLNEGKIATAGYSCKSSLCRGGQNILHKVPMQFIKNFPEANMVVLGTNSKRSPCTGDSGGPDFIDYGGKTRAFALVSTGPESCEAGLSVDTLIEPYRGWLDQAMNGVRTGHRSSLYSLKEF